MDAAFYLDCDTPRQFFLGFRDDVQRISTNTVDWLWSQLKDVELCNNHVWTWRSCMKSSTLPLLGFANIPN